MAVFRIERTRDYTVMSNHHLRNANLSLKAKGLLSMILSLPEEWNYTTRGLASICKEGVDAIGSALKELETAGYIVRRQLRGTNGRITDTEYVIYEQPQPDMSQPDTASPDTENPDMVKPDTEKPAELNIEKSNTQKSITDGLSSTDSIPFRGTAAARPPERKGRDAMSVTEIENYRELILENIEYDYLCREFATYREDLDEIVELMVETVCARRKTTRIAGSDFPHEVVRSRFLKLDSEHIRFVMDSLQKNTTEVFVVLVIGSLISLSFSKESIPAEKLKLGDAAPQLMLCDSVQLLDLHDAREGYTLLSFWASYDAASREKNAALAHLADKHSQIKMISVSFDRYVSVFNATVKQDGLLKNDCYVETDGSDSEIFRAYDLERGFKNYLIDSRGIIVAKNVTATELASYLN